MGRQHSESEALSLCPHPTLHVVSSLEKTLPQLLAKLSLLENRRAAHNTSLTLSASIGRVRELIAQARGAANKVGESACKWQVSDERSETLTGVCPTQVKVPMKFNGTSGVQLRTPRDISDLAAYTALKFYLQRPEPAPGQAAGSQFVLYMGSRQVPGRLDRGLGWKGHAGSCPLSPTPTGHW